MAYSFPEMLGFGLVTLFYVVFKSIIPFEFYALLLFLAFRNTQYKRPPLFASLIFLILRSVTSDVRIPSISQYSAFKVSLFCLVL